MEKLTDKDPATRSPDLVIENIDQLAVFFPDAFTEGAIDFDVLKQLLGGATDDREEKYGLTWHGKRGARQVALTPSTGTLRPAPDESLDWESTHNLMIEGDNLEVLKLLQKSYHGKVKLIYIDPPYNTGNDFIYPDDYSESLQTYLEYTGQVDDEGKRFSTNTDTDGRFHSRWLSMMYPRLFLARNLMEPTGAIFVTIDDTEVANLRELMDEIWGEENFVATIAWQKVFAKKNKALISGSHDHILVYAKSLEQWSRNLLPRDEQQATAFKNPDNDPRGPWQSVSFSVQSEDSERRKAYRYEISLPSGRKVGPPAGRHWNGLPARYEELLNDNRLWFGQSGDNPPRAKTFLSEVQQGIVPDTWWRHEDAGNNQEAKKEILDLFGESEPFSTPKPTRLIRKMIQIATDKDSLVLDFFAGSGTTAHAVMAENLADGGNRHFLLVQLPEPTGREDFPTIADITKTRIRRASAKLSAETASGLDLAGNANWDRGFRVFKLDSSNIEAWDPHPEDIAGSLLASLDHLRDDRTEDDIFYELLLKLGLDLTIRIECRTIAGNKVYCVAACTLVACLADSLDQSDIEDLALGIAAWRDELHPAGDTVVVFRDSAFTDDVAKTNITAILEQHGMPTVRSL